MCLWQVFRATDGKASVWGKKPKIIIAKYKTGNGSEATSLLLASGAIHPTLALLWTSIFVATGEVSTTDAVAGYWGLSRHFHYVPEILAAVFWTAPAGFGHLLVWFYVIFLTLLLTDRSFRDDQRCSSKYGSYWETYCKAVSYRMVPFVY